MRSEPQTTLVIGATSSMAQALCRTLAARGQALVLAGRDEDELNLLADDLSVRSGARPRILVADLIDAHFSAVDFVAEAGEFDRAVIVAGDMGSGDVADIENLRAVTAINYIVPAQIATAIGDILRARGSGDIAIVSSVAGDRGRQSNYPYGSAKAALTAFASGLRNRLYRDGVHVMTIKPGFVDTPMTWNMKSPLIASRESVAEKIADAMEKKKDVLYVPWFWAWIMLIICAIPERIFKKLKL